MQYTYEHKGIVHFFNSSVLFHLWQNKNSKEPEADMNRDEQKACHILLTLRKGNPTYLCVYNFINEKLNFACVQ